MGGMFFMFWKAPIYCVTLTLIILITISGCDSATDKPTAGSPATSATTGSPDATASRAVHSSPSAAPMDVSTSPAFLHYRKVKLGMAKADVDNALGLKAVFTLGDETDSIYSYTDSDGYGVIVYYNDELKVYCKMALYNDAAKVLAPLTVKPVTKELCSKISKGTTYAKIVELLGGEGVECIATAKKNNVNKLDGWLYRWGNEDGSYIQIIILANGTASDIMFYDK